MSRCYTVIRNPFIPLSQKDLCEEAIEDLISSHLEHYVRLDEYSNHNNSRITSYDFISRIDDDQFVCQNILEALLKCNTYNIKNKIIYLQGVALTGFLQKKKKEEEKR